MCIGVWALDHPDYALILCTNRDEYLSRPTSEAHFHNFGDKSESDVLKGNILSGRDLQAGGTWMGVNRSGRVALLTNITEPASQFSSSRGYLVSSYLLSEGSGSFKDDLETFDNQDAKYAGFNLLLLSPSAQASGLSFEAALVTNHGGGGVIESRLLTAEERNCGGMANGVDGQGGNEWPKVTQGVQSLSELLAKLPRDINESALTESLFKLLTWQSAEPPKERADLRNTIHIEPLPITLGDGKPADKYGTRLSTVILIRRDGSALFIERDIWKLDEDGELTTADFDDPSERAFRLQVPI